MMQSLHCGKCLINNSLKYVLFKYGKMFVEDFSNDTFHAVYIASFLSILRLLS